MNFKVVFINENKQVEVRKSQLDKWCRLYERVLFDCKRILIFDVDGYIRLS